MAFRKLSADQLFDGENFLDGDQILVTDEQGIIEGIVPRRDARDDIEILHGILSPGFINCHVHLELSHMKRMIPESTGLVQFVLDVVQQRHLPEEKILEAIGKAEDEMLRNGIVAAGDICNNLLTLPQKNKGRLYYHNFIEASGYHPSLAHPRFARSLEFFYSYASQYSIPVASNSITPHAPYSVSDELWDMILKFPGNHLFTIHNQETEEEDRWFLHKQGGFHLLYEKMKIDTNFFQPTGRSSLQSFLPKFLPNQQLILVHNVHTTGDDIVFAKQTAIGNQLYWCLCPNANKYITGKLPDLELLTQHDCKIVFGTDSLASNHQLSIWEEIKTIRDHFPAIPISKFLHAATLQGAKALELDARLGSFEKGKIPGVLVIDPKRDDVKRIM